MPLGLAGLRRHALRSLFCLCLLLCTGLAKSDEEEGQREPSLTLPGGHEVQAGQHVDLRWSAEDSIRELEILLSVDGGRTYSTCISPQLDPKLCRFLWRVPEIAGRHLRIRIRFNRDGRETEGAPIGLVVAPDRPDAAIPLGLPGERPSRGQTPENGRGGGSSTASEAEVASHDKRPPDDSGSGWRNFVSLAPRQPLAQAPALDRAPDFVPLRA